MITSSFGVNGCSKDELKVIKGILRKRDAEWLAAIDKIIKECEEDDYEYASDREVLEVLKTIMAEKAG